VRWTTSDQWHVTLQFLGEQSETEMVDRLSEGRWVGLPMKIRIGPSAELLGPEAAVLPARAPGLEALANRVTELTGVPRTRPFKGHLTLARARGRAPRRALEPVKGLKFEDDWVAPSVVLVRSTLTPGGARYETVEEFRPTL
jgi:2'-5' RNA ligase